MDWFASARNALCIVTALVAITPAAFSAGDSSAKVAKEDILAAVVAAQSAVKDMSVSYSFDALKAPPDPNYMGYRMHQDVTLKGDRTYVRREFGKDPKFDKALVRREVAYNGERSILHDVNYTNCMIRTKRDSETTLSSVDFMDFLMLSPPDKSRYGVTPQSLASLLESPKSRLRDAKEEFGGRECCVVDLLDETGSAVSVTVWLDPSRGFLPVRKVHFERSGKPFLEFVVDDGVEVAPGVWMPVSGVKRARNPGESPADSWQFENALKVDVKSDGGFKLAVNAGVEDAFFDLWKRVPAGTLIFDEASGLSYTAGGGDAKTFAETPKPAVTEEAAQAPEAPRAETTEATAQAPEAPRAETAQDAPATLTAPVSPESRETNIWHVRCWKFASVYLLPFCAILAVIDLVRRRRKNAGR